MTVSLLSIEGNDCRVVELGQVANRTGGQVTMVNPLTVTEEFGSILNNPVIATDVVSKIIVHHGMYVVIAAENCTLIVSCFEGIRLSGNSLLLYKGIFVMKTLKIVLS